MSGVKTVLAGVHQGLFDSLPSPCGQRAGTEVDMPSKRPLPPIEVNKSLIFNSFNLS